MEIFADHSVRTMKVTLFILYVNFNIKDIYMKCTYTHPNMYNESICYGCAIFCGYFSFRDVLSESKIKSYRSYV